MDKATRAVMEGRGDWKEVLRAHLPALGAVRVSLFVVLALYAWAIVWVLEGWRASRSLRSSRFES